MGYSKKERILTMKKFAFKLIPEGQIDYKELQKDFYKKAKELINEAIEVKELGYNKTKMSKENCFDF